MNALFPRHARFLNGQTVFFLLLAVGLHVAVLSLDIPEPRRCPPGGLEGVTLHLAPCSPRAVQKEDVPETAKEETRSSPPVTADPQARHRTGDKATRSLTNLSEANLARKKRAVPQTARTFTFQKPAKIEPIVPPETNIDSWDGFEAYSPPDDNIVSGQHLPGPAKRASVFEDTPVEEGSRPGFSGTTHPSEPKTTYAKPEYKENAPPDYPRMAMRRGYEGRTRLNVQVLDTGRVGRIEIAASSGFDILDDAALKAVKHWRFVPGTVNGKRSTQWVIVPVRFDLQRERGGAP